MCVPAKHIYGDSISSLASSATGDYGASSAGRGAVAMAIEYESKAKGDINSWLVLAECIKDDNGETFIQDLKSVKVDGKKIKADTWYQLKRGKFVKLEE